MSPKLSYIRRPEPKHGLGILYKFKDGEMIGVFIPHNRRWIKKPSGSTGKRWVYDGPIYHVVNGEVKFRTYGFCINEEGITPVE